MKLKFSKYTGLELYIHETSFSRVPDTMERWKLVRHTRKFWTSLGFFHKMLGTKGLVVSVLLRCIGFRFAPPSMSFHVYSFLKTHVA